jgi:hypothetical protein
MNLYRASNQWANRPDDERFTNLDEMLASCRYYRESAATATVALSNLRATADSGEVRISGNAATARLTNWAFGQLARIAEAPAGYLRTLPAALACDNLNCKLPTVEGDGKLLLHRNGDLIMRCITSDDYVRIWNTDVIERLQGLGSEWRVPPARPARQGQAGSRPATAADVLAATGFGLSVNVGDMIAPAGLYASDHDMFAFMVNESRRIEDGSDGGLSRGFFISNSEVGAGALRLTTFMYRHVCGNHIVWGASNVTETKIVHRGRAGDRFNAEFLVELKRYADDAASEDEARIVSAKRCIIAADKDSVIDLLFGKRLLSRRQIAAAYDYAEQEESNLAPTTVWGMVQGITRLSQDCQFAEERVDIDRAAGKVLEMAF